MRANFAAVAIACLAVIGTFYSATSRAGSALRFAFGVGRRIYTRASGARPFAL